jgi:hypothetical protein
MTKKNQPLVSDDLLSRIATMQRGVYKLDQEVPNPSADRRKHDDWHASPVIKPGLFYLIPDVHTDDNIRVLTMTLNRVGKKRQSIRAEMRINLDTSRAYRRWDAFSNPLISALLPLLTPTWDARGWLELVEQEDSTAPHEVIAVLIERGILTPDLLESAAQEVRRRADSEI